MARKTYVVVMATGTTSHVISLPLNSKGKHEALTADSIEASSMKPSRQRTAMRSRLLSLTDRRKYSGAKTNVKSVRILAAAWT